MAPPRCGEQAGADAHRLRRPVWRAVTPPGRPHIYHNMAYVQLLWRVVVDCSALIGAHHAPQVGQDLHDSAAPSVWMKDDCPQGQALVG